MEAACNLCNQSVMRLKHVVEFDRVSIRPDRSDAASHPLQVRLSVEFCVRIKDIVPLVDLIAAEIRHLSPKATTQSCGVGPQRWIGRVLIQIETAGKTYRVVTNETARRSVIVPMPVVMQPCFGIMLLPLKPYLSKLANAQN